MEAWDSGPWIGAEPGFSRQGRLEAGSQGTGLGAEGGVWRRPRIVGRALGRELVVWVEAETWVGQFGAQGS